MISNERTWPSQRRVYYQQSSSSSNLRPPRPQPRPLTQEDTLRSEQLQIERKEFFITLKENPRGRFVRISEEAGGRRNTIIIPITGLAEFCRVLEEMNNANGEFAPAPPEALA